MKAIIFDLDGVICHTDEYHYLAWKAMADGLGVHFDREINNRLRGVSRMASLEIILERAHREYSAAEKEALATYKNDVYKELLKSLTSGDILPGVVETLNELRARGYKLAIGSSSKNAPVILKQIGLEGFFDAISDGNNITNSKPDPEVFIKGALFLGLDCGECYVVEDAKAGVDAGKAGGFTTIALGDAYGYKKSDYSVKDFCEILTIA
jgi:beta-phosphoglucomutase